MRTLSFAHGTFKDIWFYLAAVSLVFNIIYTFRPQLVVQAATSLDTNPLAALFTLTDQSPWTFYNVSMECIIWNGVQKLGTVKNNTFQLPYGAPATGNQTIEVLEAYKPATRDCGFAGIKFNRPSPALTKIDLNLSYDWLFGYKTKLSNWHFDTRKVGDKFILVPDVEPSF